MNFRERIERGRGFQDELTANDNAEKQDTLNFNFFAVENLRSQLACVDLRLADGSRKAVPYSYIMEVDFDASEGIGIKTVNKLIKIKGRNLNRLYEYLTLFRVKYVQENIGTDVCESGLFVKEIKIEET